MHLLSTNQRGASNPNRYDNQTVKAVPESANTAEDVFYVKYDDVEKHTNSVFMEVHYIIIIFVLYTQ